MPMEKNTRRMLGYIAFGVSLFAALNHVGFLTTTGRKLFHLVSPLIAGLILAFVLHVPVNLLTAWLEKLFQRRKRKPSHKKMEVLALLLTLLIIVLILVLACTITIPHLLLSFRSIYETLSMRIPEWITAWEEAEWYTALGLNGWLETLDIQKLLEPLKGLSILGYALDLSSSILSGIVLVSIEIVIAVYVILSRRELCRSTKRMAYAWLPKKAADWLCHLAKLVNESYSKFFTGQLLESCILGLLMFVTLSVFGVPYAGITAVLTAICAFVPYVGAFLSCAIGAILASLVAMKKAIICVVVYVITQFIENQFIYPHVVGNSVGLHPGLTLIAVILGERISGLVGMIFAIPMMAVLYTLISESVQKALHNRRLDGLE